MGNDGESDLSPFWMPLVSRDFGLGGGFGPDDNGFEAVGLAGWLEFEFCRDAALEFLDKISIFPTHDVNIWSIAEHCVYYI